MIYAAVRAQARRRRPCRAVQRGGSNASDAKTGAVARGHEAVMGVPQGDHVIAGAGVPSSATQRTATIAYKLGVTGKLADTVGSSPTSRMLAVVDAALAAAQPAAALPITSQALRPARQDSG